MTKTEIHKLRVESELKVKGPNVLHINLKSCCTRELCHLSAISVEMNNKEETY